jgi:PAS domain S-box-containing protein
MLDDAPHGFMAIDRDGRCLYINPVGARLLRQETDALLGRVVWEVFSGSLESPFGAGFRRALETGVGERVLAHFAGLDAWFEAHYYPIETGVAVHYDDVSDRKRLEEQLRQSQKLEAVGRLAGSVAHDFNNLLAVILSYAQMLANKLPAGSPVRADILEIRDAGERAANLTRQLLAFSRQQVIQPRVVELGKLVQGMERLLRRMVGPEVVLSIVTARPAGNVDADPNQVEQVVMNLVVNARDAMPGGGKVTVETASVLLDAHYAASYPDVTPGPYVMLEVTDTGTGMDAATRERMFEPFFTTRSARGGTGLGLATVFGIVKQAGGHVQVDSEPGRGTTFKVYFPGTDREADAVLPRPEGLAGVPRDR